MFSLISTVQSIRLIGNILTDLSLRQHQISVETKLSHGQHYRIPSLFWPPPNNCIKHLPAQLSCCCPFKGGQPHVK